MDFLVFLDLLTSQKHGIEILPAYKRGLRIKNHGMIRKLRSGEYRLYSRKKNPKTNRRRNLGTFKTLAAAKKHEKAIQYFKRH
jgi:hypothetical protein